MNRFLPVSLALVVCLWALPWLPAQAPAGGDSAATGQNKQPPASQSSANPFPDDTSAVPVMPSAVAPASPEKSYNTVENAPLRLPGDDLDPVRSPDDPEPDTAGAEGSSSSLAGLEHIEPGPDDNQPSKKKKPLVKETTHKEAASKDIEVGGYYLETKNWKGALSRFNSALVLDPENPDVYWGLAEADRHLGRFADARANYEKVAEYDPDSRHGKEAIKALKEPEIANGKNPAAPPSPTAEAQQ